MVKNRTISRLPKSVVSIGRMNFKGNILPHSWFRFIRYPNGKPHLTAIVVLSDIVYYYRPVEVEDELTGKVIGHRKKFRADKLQRNYQYYVDNFGLTKNQARLAFDFLVEFGVITREFRHFKQMSNVMFVEPVVAKLIEITFTDQDHIEAESEMDPPHVELEIDMGLNKSRDGVELESDTYTKSSSHETSTKDTHEGQAPQTPHVCILDSVISHSLVESDKPILWQKPDGSIETWSVDKPTSKTIRLLRTTQDGETEHKLAVFRYFKPGERLLYKNGSDGYHPVILGELVEDEKSQHTMTENAKALFDKFEDVLGWNSVFATTQTSRRDYAELTTAAIKADESGKITVELLDEYQKIWRPKYDTWRGTMSIDALRKTWNQFLEDRQNGYIRSNTTQGGNPSEVTQKFNSGEYRRSSEAREQAHAHVKASNWGKPRGS